MSRTLLLNFSCILALGGVAPAALAQRMERAEEPREAGLTSVGEAHFPNPGGYPDAAIPNGGFEEEDLGGAWRLSGFRRVEDPAAPQGRAVLRQEGRGAASLDLTVPARGGVPWLFSLWLRAAEEGSGSILSETSEIIYGRSTPLEVPGTGGAWRRVGFYFRAAPGAAAARVQLRFPPGAAAELDDLRFREAGEEEFTRAWSGWRARYPGRDLSPRPGDGANLALFVSKLARPVAPDEPLRVMGIGSSYTNMLGNGERLVQWVREHFPGAPPVLYEKHVGSAVEFDFTRGWMRQHVLGRRPDLVILYSGGRAEDLEALLADFRGHSTADVIVASLHLRERDGGVTEEAVKAPEWDAIREVALRHGCEWVDNRREWAAYLQEHGQPIEWLLRDAVHQNDHGALVINENICRHVAAHPAPSSPPESRERWLGMGREAPEGEAEAAWASGPLAEEAELLPGRPSLALVPGGRGEIRVRFRGNRIDLAGRRLPGGGSLASAEMRLDGVPLDELPVFHTTLIVPGPDNHRPERGSPADRSPHQIVLGPAETLAPQAWTLRMWGDAGAYQLIGSVTGPDGYGHNGDPFTSNSGQIRVPPELWRRRLEPDGETYANRDGDAFTWRVERATAGEVSFRGEEGWFTVTLADQLDYGWHELALSAPGAGGPCVVAGFRVHEPPFAPGRER